MTQVLDYVSRPSAAQIAQAGFAGAVRYLSPPVGGQPNPKNTSAAEVADFAAHGLAMGFVWEWYASRPTEGFQAGVADGHAAAVQAQALGVARGAGIFFAVDEQVPAALWAAVAGYLDGARQGCDQAGYRRCGYGQEQLGSRMLTDSHAALWWGTAAWSGSYRDPRMVLFQHAAQVTVGGHTCDVNDVLAADWGQWLPGAPIPVPTPPSGGTKEDDPMILVPSWATFDQFGRCPFYEAVPVDDTSFAVYSFNGAPLDRVDGEAYGQWYQRQTGTSGPLRGLGEAAGIVVGLCHGGGGGVYRIATKDSTSAGHP